MRRTRWETAFWGLTALFLGATLAYYLVGPETRGWLKLFRFLSFEFEQNLATLFEGLCFLIVALKALERSLADAPGRWAYRGLALLTAGLSLDELGSIHERSDLLFSPLGLDDEMLALLPFAIPAAAIAGLTLLGFLAARETRRGRLLFFALALMGSVVVQEKLEQALALPAWAAPLRGVVEEGTEMLALFLLLRIVIERGAPMAAALPSAGALVAAFPPALLLALVGAPALYYVMIATRSMQRGRGVPGGFVVFALLVLLLFACVRLAERQPRSRGPLLGAAAVAALFAADAVIVLGRMESGRVSRSDPQDWAFPLLAGLLLLTPAGRRRGSLVLLLTLLALSASLTLGRSRLNSWVFEPAQLAAALFVVTEALRNDAEPAVL